ncbi:MAG: putative phosphoglycerate mutase [Gammaproteobacteria bacterium]|jgi:probable phosphoglycerate mutase
MNLYLIRHGITDWNLQKRIQGRIDRPLSESGRTTLGNKQIPEGWRAINWSVSPLLRAKQSAEILGISNPVIEPKLIEMNWGDWEGQVLKQLRRQLGDPMRENESRGLDLQPPNGESPRAVMARVREWLDSLMPFESDQGAVVHKGIIRCVYALASGWDMRGESPVQFDWEKAHVFRLTQCGELLPDHDQIEMG